MPEHTHTPPDPSGSTKATSGLAWALRWGRRVFPLMICLMLLTGARKHRKRKRRHAKRPTTGTVLVQSTTAGAVIYIDGNEIGEVPMRLPLALRAGDHSVKLTKPGYADYLDTFKLKPGKDRVLEIDLLPSVGVLQIDGTPAQALVFLDGLHVGELPYEGDMDPGPRKVEVRAQGFGSHETALEVEAGAIYPLSVQLLPLQTLAAPVGPTPWYGHWWVWGGAAAVAGGVTAALLLSGDKGLPEPDLIGDMALEP